MQVGITTYFGESASGIGALGFDGKAFLIQLITFVLAFLVLKRYVFKPILKVMQERRETIESSVKLGEQMQKEQAEMESKIAKIMQEARQQADGIVAGAQDTSRQMVREAEDKAKTKAAGVLKDAESRITQDTARARKQLEKEVVSLVSEVTEVVLEEKVDAPKDRQLIERALKERQAA